MMFLPIVITLIAGLATAAGALLGSLAGKKYQAVSLAFATGLMLMISMGELVPEACMSVGTGTTIAFMAFGALVSFFLDMAFPHEHDHGQAHEEHDCHTDMRTGEEPGHYINECECSHSETVSRGMITALLLHNILEGLATGLTVRSNARLGMTMALGIAIHNIPIGATLAVSIVSSGKSRLKSVLYSAFVGLIQPLGALIGMLFIGLALTNRLLACCMACVAGTLVFISFDELWPAARMYGSRKITILSLLAGIAFIMLTESVA